MQLTKNKNGVYHATYRNSDGKSRTISTEQTSRAKALAVVKEAGIAEMERAVQAGRLTREILGRLTTGKRMTLAKAIPPFREWLTSRGRSSKMISEAEITINAWTREMKLETMPPAAITETHISKWINAERERSAGSRKVALAHIRTLFSFLAAKGWIVGDPSQGVGVDYSALSHEQKEPAERQPFTQDELTKLIAYLKGQLTGLEKDMARVEKDEKYTAKGREVALAKLRAKHSELFFWLFAVRCSSQTGLRLSDIASLEWRSFESGKLVVWTGKTNKRVEHKLPADLETMVTQKAIEDAQYIFPAQRAVITNVDKRSAMSVAFTRLCQRIGIMGRSFHSLRHFNATHTFAKMDKEKLAAKLAEVLTLDQIAALLGHSSKKSTKGYIH